MSTLVSSTLRGFGVGFFDAVVFNAREFAVLAAFGKFFNAGVFDAAGWENVFNARDFDAGGTSTRGFLNMRVRGEL